MSDKEGDGEEAPAYEPKVILEQAQIEKGLSNLQRTPGKFLSSNPVDGASYAFAYLKLAELDPPI